MTPTSAPTPLSTSGFDRVEAAVHLAESLVRMSLSTSKIRTYARPDLDGIRNLAASTCPGVSLLPRSEMTDAEPCRRRLDEARSVPPGEIRTAR